MKKIIPILISILSFTFIFSCNQNDSTIESGTNKVNDSSTVTSGYKYNWVAFDNICNGPGLANFTIDKKEAEAMIKHFKDIYINSSDQINLTKDSFWVDACAIKALGKYMDTAKGVSGLRIVSAAEKAGTKNETKIFLVTTKDTLRAPGTKTRDDKWDVIIPNTDCKDSKKYFARFRDASNQIKLYEGAYRHNPMPETGTALKDSLSKKVWIDKCVISRLAGFIESNPSVDGINIKLGAYFTKDPNGKHPGQGYDHQSTVIIIPTTGKIDNWKIVEMIKDLVVKAFGDAALNHGALCPQICN